MKEYSQKTYFNIRKNLPALLVSFSLGVLVGFILFYSYFSNSPESASLVEKASASSRIEMSTPHKKTPRLELETITVKETLEKDAALYNILRDNNIAPGEISDLVTASKTIHDLNRIKPGNTLELTISAKDNSLACLKYEIDKDNFLLLEKSANGFNAKKEEVIYDTKLSAKSAVISNSLFNAVTEAGLVSRIALDLSDIFAWDIDFSVDIRRGDKFRILFEQKYRQEDFVRDGKILCAEFVNQGKTFWAILFEDNDGHIDYYDLDGNSLQKQFLKSPLRYKYISSGYSRRRLHPILKIYRPHLGIDYAAPVGTPVVSIGDGKVLYAGRKGGYGKFVKIRHNSSYSSTYGHLSRFGRGIKRNSYVKQGQVIGYVGSTGLSTGPHLDFRLIKNGSFINPKTCNLPSAKPVKQIYVKDFQRVKEKMTSKLMESCPIIAAHGE